MLIKRAELAVSRCGELAAGVDNAGALQAHRVQLQVVVAVGIVSEEVDDVSVIEAGVYIDRGNSCDLAARDGVGKKISRAVNAELEVYLAVPAVGGK